MVSSKTSWKYCVVCTCLVELAEDVGLARIESALEQVAVLEEEAVATVHHAIVLMAAMTCHEAFLFARKKTRRSLHKSQSPL